VNGSINAQLAPTRAHRRGLGATDPFASAKALLAGSMSAPIAFGDALAMQGNFYAAVQQYQAAGRAGANANGVGDVIKAAGGNAAVMVGTVADNSVLQGIDFGSSSASASDAATAAGLVKGMVALYEQAMALPTVGQKTPTKALPPPASGASSKTAYYVAGGVAAVALGTGAWWLYGRNKR